MGTKVALWGGLIATFLLGTFSLPCYAAVNLQINGQDVEQGQSLTLSQDDFVNKRIEFSIAPEEKTNAVQISLDGGRSWSKMKKDGERFVYRYRPAEGEKLNVVLNLESSEDQKEMYDSGVVVVYEGTSPEVAIYQILKELKTAYENENAPAFLSFISSVFPNLTEFKESIQEDFQDQRTIRLFFQEQGAQLSPDKNEAIYDVLWKRNSQDSNGANTSFEQIIRMKFKKGAQNWELASMRDNTIFGSSLSGTIDLTVASMSFSGADVVLTVNVNNNGSKPVENVKVNFYFVENPTTSTNRQLHGSQTIASIGANSQVSITRSLVSLSPITVQHDFIVVLDPDNTIAEIGEGNNESVLRYTP